MLSKSNEAIINLYRINRVVMRTKYQLTGTLAGKMQASFNTKHMMPCGETYIRMI
jgi:hypothetical protein